MVLNGYRSRHARLALRAGPRMPTVRHRFPVLQCGPVGVRDMESGDQDGKRMMRLKAERYSDHHACQCVRILVIESIVNSGDQ